MSHLKALKNALTLEDVATLLECKPSSLSYLLYVKSESRKYNKFDIPKNSGGVRHISAPSKDLMLVQSKLSNILQNCIHEINEKNGHADGGEKPDIISHGFRRKRSIATNAIRHRNRKYVFNVDIQNFFGEINFGRVRGFFISDRNFQLNPKVATLIAQVACFENSLPQGSPCSPVISNLIGHILDIHLVRLAKKYDCIYSRYADDLTFSTNLSSFPEKIAYKSPADPNSWLPGSQLSRLVIKCGFAINPAKTRMHYRDSRQEVTGLVVNKKVNVRSEYRHGVRSMVHRLFTNGEFYLERIVHENCDLKRKHIKGDMQQLHGMLGFIDWVDKINKIRLREKSADLSSKEKMCRRFLMYKEFYAAAKPVLICEGKTDNVYITHAIRRLASDYPSLASINSSGKISIEIRRFRYTETSTGRILGLGGGSGDLKHLLLAYQEDASKFGAPGMQFPVIVLVDNDSGAKPVFAAAKQIIKANADMAAQFTHITKNLYLMATPTPGGAGDSAIEDLFDSTLKSTKLGTRSFSASNTADTSIYYGKADFAYKVVKMYADSIDFTGFKPLLDRFVSVIAHHRALMLSTASKSGAP